MVLKEKGIDKLLDEAREDNRENDARLMSPKRECFSCDERFCDAPSKLINFQDEPRSVGNCISRHHLALCDHHVGVIIDTFRSNEQNLLSTSCI